MLNNIKTMKSDKGFTIVELLIVIVVIAILAAITIVAYNGIQNRAKTNAGLSLANSTIKKLESYNAVVGSYPTLRSQIQGTTVKEANIDGLAAGTVVDTDPLVVPATDSLVSGTALDGTTALNGKAIRISAASATTGTVRYYNYETSAEVPINYGS